MFCLTDAVYLVLFLFFGYLIFQKRIYISRTLEKKPCPGIGYFFESVRFVIAFKSLLHRHVPALHKHSYQVFRQGFLQVSELRFADIHSLFSLEIANGVQKAYWKVTPLRYSRFFKKASIEILRSRKSRICTPTVSLAIGP